MQCEQCFCCCREKGEFLQIPLYGSLLIDMFDGLFTGFIQQLEEFWDGESNSVYGVSKTREDTEDENGREQAQRTL